MAAVLTGTAVQVVFYTFLCLIFCITSFRLVVSWARDKRWDTQGGWMFTSLIFLIGLGVAGHGIKYDTNNVLHPELLTADEIARREIGSKMVLLGRFCYTSTIWCMKFSILAMYTTIVGGLCEYKRFIKYIWATLLLTWVGIIIVTLFECRPFNHYWQVYPSPGRSCTVTEGQIYTFAICNIITDLILIIFPMPIVFRTRLPPKQKIEICCLFSLGLIIVAVNALRLPLVAQHGSLQRWRTLLGTFEILAACFVSNAPALYRFFLEKPQTTVTPKRLSASESVVFSRPWPVKEDEHEFRDPRDAPTPESGSATWKNTAVDIEMWGVQEREQSGEWETDTSTAGSVGSSGVRGDYQERHERSSFT